MPNRSSSRSYDRRGRSRDRDRGSYDGGWAPPCNNTPYMWGGNGIGATCNGGGGTCGGGCGGGGCGGGCGGGPGNGGYGWNGTIGGWNYGCFSNGCNGWNNGCGGFTNGAPVPVPWPYPIMVPAAPVAPTPMPASFAPFASPPYPFFPSTGSALTDALAPAYERLRQNAMLAVQRGLAMMAPDTFAKLGNALDQLRARLAQGLPGVATPSGLALPSAPTSLLPAPASPASPSLALPPIQVATASCAGGSCTVRELGALNDTLGRYPGETYVPNGTQVDVLGQMTGTIRLHGAAVGPRAWAHVRVRASDGSLVEGWMLPESVVVGTAPLTSPSPAYPSTGKCGCSGSPAPSSAPAPGAAGAGQPLAVGNTAFVPSSTAATGPAVFLVTITAVSSDAQQIAGQVVGYWTGSWSGGGPLHPASAQAIVRLPSPVPVTLPVSAIAGIQQNSGALPAPGTIVTTPSAPAPAPSPSSGGGGCASGACDLTPQPNAPRTCCKACADADAGGGGATVQNNPPPQTAALKLARVSAASGGLTLVAGPTATSAQTGTVANGTTVQLLSGDLPDASNAAARWILVRTPTGAIGYVPLMDVQSGAWNLTLL